MKSILKSLVIIVTLLIVPLIIMFEVDSKMAAQVRPPKLVQDVASCLGWLNEPKFAFKITANGAVYYQIMGEHGRTLASGPAGYAFDSNGKYIGWSVDTGDYYSPDELYVNGATRVPISIEELREKFSLHRQP